MDSSLFEIPKREWSCELDGDSIVFFQRGLFLKVPSQKFTGKELDKLVNSSHYCWGCIDLPVDGYDSDKSSWCQFSRSIANLYDDGYKWEKTPAIANLERTWSCKLNGNWIVFTQNGQTLKVPYDEFNPTQIANIIDAHFCEGCMELPKDGYASSNDSWCSTSLKIADLYLEGYEWEKL